MPRTETGTHTPESLATIAAALQAIVDRLKRTAESMKEKGAASLEVKNQAGLKAGIATVRSFAMSAEEAFEEWIFDQNVFQEAQKPAAEPAKPRAEGAGRKPKKQQQEDEPD